MALIIRQIPLFRNISEHPLNALVERELLDAGDFKRLTSLFGKSFCSPNIEKELKNRCCRNPSPEDSSMVPEKKDIPWEMSVNMAGMEPSDISVRFENNLLKVQGERKTDGKYSFIQQQRTLPDGVSPEDLKAQFTDEGILKIQQKQQKEKTQAVHIDVESGNKLSSSPPPELET